MDVLLGLSNEYAYLKGKPPAPLREPPFAHDPWFWCVPERGEDPAACLERIRTAWHQANESLGPDVPPDEQNPLQKIKAIGELQTVRSFASFGTSRPAFPVYARRSYFVPEISDQLFQHHRVFTAEHDIPYQQRACVDLAAHDKGWVFDTRGQKTKLKVLVYDIETTMYGSGTRGKDVPVDMIGWSSFDLSYEASKDLDKEEFNFNLVDAPPHWQDCPVEQSEATNRDEEVRLLLQFVRRVPEYDIIAGHNILGFDNREIYMRIEDLLRGNRNDRTLSVAERRSFEEFTTRWAAKDRTFSFGQQQETVNFYPTSLDTYHAARRFYFFLDDFTLKKVAPFLGVKVPNRVYLSPSELKVGDPRTREYNRHDVQEQLGITMLLLAQALPLAFTVGWTFEEVLTGGNVRMWDHMAAIRAARQRKLLPATCRAQSVARTVLSRVGPRPAKSQIWEKARLTLPEEQKVSHVKEFLRVAKYGDEMPDWVELPTAIVNPKAVAQQQASANGAEGPGEDEEEEELLSYAIPGGMTIHPQEVGAHMIPWWHVVTADVGAMYPTILRARNVGADTVRLARKDEAPDDWVWLFKVSEELTKDDRFHVRKPGPEDTFAAAGQGVMLGIKLDPNPGLTTLAMKGVMGVAAKVKKQLAQARKDGLPKSDVDRLAMAYASLKANRNAGTHGQMLAVNVSCRGFNLWAGAEITTIGQKILADTKKLLNERRARIVYGDTDGLYIGCSRSGKNLPEVADALGVEFAPNDQAWYILPDEAVKAIQEANEAMRKFLKYEAFELEAEHHDAMVFVVHKNYLIFDVKNGKLRMTTKGNNFRGSDKAPIAQKVLEDVMRNALRDTIEWEDEEEAREALKAAIKKWTRESFREFDASKVDRDDLVLVQVVQPTRDYKPNPDGSDSIWTKRAKAIEKLTGEPLRASKKFRFVVCKKPISDEIKKPSKTGIKPLDYMWPVDFVKSPDEIDLAWYKDMIEKYVRGAFGFEDLALHAQKGLDAWM